MQIGIIFFLKFNLLLNKYLQGTCTYGNIKSRADTKPNTMKIVLSNKREDNKSNTFTYIEEQQPQFINDLLAIDGVKSIFYVMDFLAIDKEPKSDWEVVLPQITSTLNNESFIDSSHKPDEHYGEIKAEALMFKGIPYQIKLTTTSDESRKQLPDYFVESMLKAQKMETMLCFT